MRTFYETLAIAMEQRGMNPAEVSAKTGIWPSYFSRLKAGYTKDVTWDKAITIITALGMTPDQFFELQNTEE